MRKKILLVLLMGMAVMSLTACESDDSYRDTLNSGLNKYYSGEEMTKSEYNAVKSFNKWKSNQEPKTYNDWGG